MKKILFTLLAISLLMGASAQDIKCGIDTKALMAEEVAAGAQSLRFLAKMVPGFNRDALAKAGITIGAQAGDIVTLRVPVESLDVLESNKEILQYSISHRIAQPTNDQARYDTRTDLVYNGIGTLGDTSINGKGVYIGITDWGFDYTNLSYNNRGDTNRRLERAWDHFRLRGPAPAGFDYGTEIVGYDALMNARGDTSNLYNYGTHGTHVTGIAAGNGIRGEYRGHAPKAKILQCSFGLGEAEWMDGVAWMRGIAQDSSRRLVVNSSWGMYSFSCLDGRSLLSQSPAHRKPLRARPLTKSQRGMGRREASPFSISFGGVYGKAVFFGFGFSNRPQAVGRFAGSQGLSAKKHSREQMLAFAEKNEFLPVRKFVSSGANFRVHLSR